MKSRNALGLVFSHTRWQGWRKQFCEFAFDTCGLLEHNIYIYHDLNTVIHAILRRGKMINTTIIIKYLNMHITEIFYKIMRNNPNHINRRTCLWLLSLKFRPVVPQRGPQWRVKGASKFVYFLFVLYNNNNISPH